MKKYKASISHDDAIGRLQGCGFIQLSTTRPTPPAIAPQPTAYLGGSVSFPSSSSAAFQEGNGLQHYGNCRNSLTPKKLQIFPL
ncbi:MAG: hypothetical protein ABSB33_13770 [Tepidisphaeraceae bacterium]